MLHKKTWRASVPRAVSMSSNPKINRGRRGRRPSNAAQKNLEGERPASRFYDFEPEEKSRTPRPASLQCCAKTWRASGPRAVSMTLNLKKNHGRRGRRPSNEAYKFEFHNVARFYHRVVQSCHINKFEVFRRQGIRKFEIGGIEKYGVRARCKPQNKRKPHANQPKQPDPFHI